MNARRLRIVLLLVLCGSVPDPSRSQSAAAASPSSPIAGSSTTDTLLAEPIPFDSVTTARYRGTGKALARAIATDDAKAFRALHTEAGWAQADEWWQAMLANQKRNFGRVVRAVGPLRGVIRGGNLGAGIPRDGAAILLRFEKEAGASLSFVLDQEGRIVKSSLWVLKELAQANIDSVEVLWEAPRRGR